MLGKVGSGGLLLVRLLEESLLKVSDDYKLVKLRLV